MRIEAVVGVVERVAAHDVWPEDERNVLNAHAILSALLDHFEKMTGERANCLAMRHGHAFEQLLDAGKLARLVLKRCLRDDVKQFTC